MCLLRIAFGTPCQPNRALGTHTRTGNFPRVVSAFSHEMIHWRTEKLNRSSPANNWLSHPPCMLGSKYAWCLEGFLVGQEKCHNICQLVGITQSKWGSLEVKYLGFLLGTSSLWGWDTPQKSTYDFFGVPRIATATIPESSWAVSLGWYQPTHR